MGTVGLSFGSPTGGAGFDVTSTVNQIVTNMQAVETPWKNQLTTLQSQDTALTSIGTDLSSLSQAMQSLTDFQGVLAEKQGSSSDTNILELTSASTAAVAGSHTVIVQSLATTSSYVSGTISNASRIRKLARRFGSSGRKPRNPISAIAEKASGVNETR